MQETQNFGTAAAKQLQDATRKKNECQKEIDELHMEICQIDTRIKKYEDDLIIEKGHKKFLDILSIQAGIKPYTPMVAKDDAASAILRDDESHAMHAGSTTIGTRGTQRPVDGGNSTFMTAVGAASPVKAGSRGTTGVINKDLSPEKEMNRG